MLGTIGNLNALKIEQTCIGVCDSVFVERVNVVIWGWVWLLTSLPTSVSVNNFHFFLMVNHRISSAEICQNIHAVWFVEIHISPSPPRTLQTVSWTIHINKSSSQPDSIHVCNNTVRPDEINFLFPVSRPTLKFLFKIFFFLLILPQRCILCA